MAEYDPAVVRAVLRENGHDVPAHGRLSGEWIDAYEAIVAAADGDQPPDPGPGPEPGEYDAGVSAADFPDEDDEPPAPVAEQRPRRPGRARGPSAKTLRARLSGGRGGAGSRKKKKHPRVPVDRLVGRVWEGLGRMATPAVPPVGRAMQWQAPVAGLILEDMVRDTVADRALQPIARAEATAEKGFALVGLPVVVGALAASQGLPEDQRLLRQAVLVPLLREIIVMNIRIMGDKAEEIAARQAEAGPLNDRADQIMAMFFAVPPEVEPEAEPDMAGV